MHFASTAAIVVSLALSLVACSSSSGVSDGSGAGGTTGTKSSGSSTHHASSSGTGAGDASSTGSEGTAQGGSSSQGGSSAQGGAASVAVTTSTASSVASSTVASTGSGGDPYAAARAACYQKINDLRAAKGGGRLPYAAWTDAEMCVDAEVTSDETTGMPHNAWLNNGDACMGNGQNECEGQGPGGITQCLDSMWAEGNQADCSGCDACADAYNSSCPNCDFFGSGPNHEVCGHYVNLSAKYFSKVACGFSSLGGWDAMNFSP